MVFTAGICSCPPIKRSGVCYRVRKNDGLLKNPVPHPSPALPENKLPSGGDRWVVRTQPSGREAKQIER